MKKLYLYNEFEKLRLNASGYFVAWAFCLVIIAVIDIMPVVYSSAQRLPVIMMLMLVINRLSDPLTHQQLTINRGDLLHPDRIAMVCSASISIQMLLVLPLESLLFYGVITAYGMSQYAAFAMVYFLLAGLMIGIQRFVGMFHCVFTPTSALLLIGALLMPCFFLLAVPFEQLLLGGMYGATLLPIMGYCLLCIFILPILSYLLYDWWSY